MLDEKLQETQAALESEEAKSKSEHRARLKLESNLQELEEKMDREVAVRDKSGLYWGPVVRDIVVVVVVCCCFVDVAVTALCECT